MTGCGLNICYISGADPGFLVRGEHLKKMRRAEGGAKIFGVFGVKNHDFTPKNHIFSNCGGRRENIWGISCEKSRFYAKKSYFFQLRGGGGRRVPPPPPLDPPLHLCFISICLCISNVPQELYLNCLRQMRQ